MVPLLASMSLWINPFVGLKTCWQPKANDNTTPVLQAPSPAHQLFTAVTLLICCPLLVWSMKFNMWPFIHIAPFLKPFCMEFKMHGTDPQPSTHMNCLSFQSANYNTTLLFDCCHLSAPWYFRLNFALYSCSQATPVTPALRRHRSSLLSTLIHSPDSTTEISPSLLPHVRRFSEDHSVNRAKRRKEENELEVQEENKDGEQEGVDKQEDGKHERIKRTATAVSSQRRSQWQLWQCVTAVDNVDKRVLHLVVNCDHLNI